MGFSTKIKKLRFTNQVIFTTHLKFCSYIFNLITFHGKEVVPHILHQLQHFFGRHLDITSSLLRIYPLETLLSSFSSWSFRVLLINTLFLHLKLQLLYFQHNNQLKTIVVPFLQTSMSTGRYVIQYNFKHTFLQIYKLIYILI